MDFKNVSIIGLEDSSVAEELADLRANEARYYWNKYKSIFITVPANEEAQTVAWIEKILAEREMKFPYTPLEVSTFEVDGIKMVLLSM